MITHELFKNQEIRALSWKQPYAELMLHGKIETRTWPTKYRGWVLICASKLSYPAQSVYNISGQRLIDKAENVLFQAREDGIYKYHHRIFKYGQAIAIGRLVDCRPMLPEDEDKCFVKYYPDLFCHVYEDVIPIEPFEWKGSQGWKKLTEEQIAKIILK